MRKPVMGLYLFSMVSGLLKDLHLSAVKRIVRYLKGSNPTGLWYPRVSSFDLDAYSDSDLWRNLDRQNMSMADLVFVGMFCGSKSNVRHSVLAIEAHFIRDAFEKILFQVLKIHTDDNCADFPTRPLIVRVVSTTFVEQFWTSAKSKIINNVRHITAKVAGKPVSIFEASLEVFSDQAKEISTLDRHQNQEAQEASQTWYHTPHCMDEEGLIESKDWQEEIP
ncbi:hypothetical protein Tco_1246147 [Tanacetum coccineum]